MTVPSKWALAQYWTGAFGHEVFAPHLEDLAHPCCFACGWFSERWTDDRSPKASWERATLERAHIIPAGLGGSDQSANIILLCASCHRESPDWFDPWEMARWISTRPERESKELEHMDTWFRAMAEVPEFTAALEPYAAEGGSAEQVVDLLRESARRAVVHGAGVGLSRATMAAILRHTTKQLPAA